MGLDRLHLLTTSGSYRLRMEWQDAVTHYWLSTEYWVFYIDDEASNYTLHVSGYVRGDDGRAMCVYTIQLSHSLVNVLYTAQSI